MAHSVTSSQPRPRCEAGLAGPDGERPVEQHHALVGPRRQVAVLGGLDAEVGAQLRVDVREAARDRPDVRVDREAQPDRVAGRRVGVLADDQHPHVGERPLEGAEDVVAGRQVGRARPRSRPAGTAPSPRSGRRPVRAPRPSRAPSVPCRPVPPARSWRARRSGARGAVRSAPERARGQVRRPPPLADLDVEDRVVGGVAEERTGWRPAPGCPGTSPTRGCRTGSASRSRRCPARPGTGRSRGRPRRARPAGSAEPGVRDVHVPGPGDPEAVGEVAGRGGPQRRERSRAGRSAGSAAGRACRRWGRVPSVAVDCWVISRSRRPGR